MAPRPATTPATAPRRKTGRRHDTKAAPTSPSDPCTGFRRYSFRIYSISTTHRSHAPRSRATCRGRTASTSPEPCRDSRSSARDAPARRTRNAPRQAPSPTRRSRPRSVPCSGKSTHETQRAYCDDPRKMRAHRKSPKCPQPVAVRAPGGSDSPPRRKSGPRANHNSNSAPPKRHSHSPPSS
jgi:hypothetical protein